MNREALRRLLRLEAANAAETSGPEGYKRKTALMAIVVAHVGRWEPKEPFCDAFARSIGISTPELKRQLADGERDFWQRTVVCLERLVEEKGGRLFQVPTDEDHWRDGFAILGDLYDEIPIESKTRQQLLPHFADYFL